MLYTETQKDKKLTKNIKYMKLSVLLKSREIYSAYGMFKCC